MRKQRRMPMIGQVALLLCHGFQSCHSFPTNFLHYDTCSSSVGRNENGRSSLVPQNGGTTCLSMAKEENYQNKVAELLSNFLPSSDQSNHNEPDSVLASIDFAAPKYRWNGNMETLAKVMDAELQEREWFVTGNVNPIFFSDDFQFSDPDVSVDGIEDYARGVYKIFDQETSRAEIISTVVNTTVPNTITCTWRLSGKVSIGPGLTIKPYIVYTDFTVDPKTGLLTFQEDRFSIPGWDIFLSALFPFLVGKVTSNPAPPVEPRVKEALAGSKVESPFRAPKLPNWFSPASTKTQNKAPTNENGLDPEYPWCFTGRLWFRPALVRVDASNTQALDDSKCISILNIGGYTIGGTVALEYDTSPVGPYKEYVSMGALVATSRGGGMVGQWGSRLYVSTKVAEEVCQDVWAVPAEVADIQFTEDNTKERALNVVSAPDPLAPANTRQNIQVSGWSKTRVSTSDSPVRGGLPIWWTPSIKALWLRLLPVFLVPLQQPGAIEENGDALPVHKLRLSASSLSLHFCGQKSSELLGVPLGIGLSVDNVLIEIGRQEGVLQ